MNYFQFINKKERIRDKDKTFLKIKLETYKTINKNSFVSVGYHEFDKEDVDLELYRGVCINKKGKGLNKKLKMVCNLDGTKVKLNFFIFTPHFFDYKQI